MDMLIQILEVHVTISHNKKHYHTEVFSNQYYNT